jgi:hypothetical protein
MMTIPSYCFGFMLVERRETLYQGNRQIKLTLVPHENDPTTRGQLTLFLSPTAAEAVEVALAQQLNSGTRFRLKLETE